MNLDLDVFKLRRIVVARTVGVRDVGPRPVVREGGPPCGGILFWDEDGLPRLSDNSILITHGNGSISAKAENSTVEIKTF